MTAGWQMPSKPERFPHAVPASVDEAPGRWQSPVAPSRRAPTAAHVLSCSSSMAVTGAEKVVMAIVNTRLGLFGTDGFATHGIHVFGGWNPVRPLGSRLALLPLPCSQRCCGDSMSPGTIACAAQKRGLQVIPACGMNSTSLFIVAVLCRLPSTYRHVANASLLSGYNLWVAQG